MAQSLQLVDKGASHAAAAYSFHDGDLVQEEFAPLVRVEDLDRGREPCGSIVNVTEQQVMPIIA